MNSDSYIGESCFNGSHLNYTAAKTYTRKFLYLQKKLYLLRCLNFYLLLYIC